MDTRPVIAAHPIIAAHRGLDEFAPENTAPALIAALELGMAVEVDLRRTSDGEIVIIHDETLDRTTSGTGPVANASLDEIKALDAGRWHDERFTGEKVPTLNDLCEIAATHGRAEVALVLETKVDDPQMGADVCRTLNDHGLMQRAIGIGTIMTAQDVRQRFVDASADFNAACLANTPQDLEPALADESSSWLYARFVPTPQQMDASHRAGKRLIASGPDVMENVDLALAAMRNGVDIALSNHPVDLAARWRDRERT